MAASRMVWADLAKGLSIVLVVYGHAVVGVNTDVPLDPWLFDTIMKPISRFRMPLFFFVAGLFAVFTVKREWRPFIDRTLLHLIYVFVLWNILQFSGRYAFAEFANHPIDPTRILWFPIWPINITWFIWALVIYYSILRLTRGIPPAIVVGFAAIVAAAPPDSWNYGFDQSARFFVYFALGYACSEPVLAMRWRPTGSLIIALLLAYLAVSLAVIHGGYADIPLIDFAIRVFGIISVLGLCMWLAERGWCGWLTWLGSYTLPIFVMHTLVTAAVREVLLRTGITDHAGVLIICSTVAGIVIPLLFQAAMVRIGFPWLFERPAWFRLSTSRKPEAAGGVA